MSPTTAHATSGRGKNKIPTSHAVKCSRSTSGTKRTALLDLRSSLRQSRARTHCKAPRSSFTRLDRSLYHVRRRARPPNLPTDESKKQREQDDRGAPASGRNTLSDIYLHSLRPGCSCSTGAQYSDSLQCALFPYSFDLHPHELLLWASASKVILLNHLQRTKKFCVARHL